jgi:transcriptional regulator with XRE-family HTH domain
LLNTKEESEENLMDSVLSTLIKRINTVRGERTVSEFSQLTKIKEHSMTQYIAGTWNLSVKIVKRIAVMNGIAVDYLLGLSNNTKFVHVDSLESTPTFADRFRYQREYVNITVEEMAELIGLNSIQAVRNYEKGVNFPSPANLAEICKCFGVTADFLLGTSTEKQREKLIQSYNEHGSEPSLFKTQKRNRQPDEVKKNRKVSNEDITAFGARIKTLRSYEKLTQTAFAKRICLCSITGGTISQWENCTIKKLPTDAVLQNICDIYGITIDWILGRDTENLEILKANKSNKVRFIVAKLLNENDGRVLADTVRKAVADAKISIRTYERMRPYLNIETVKDGKEWYIQCKGYAKPKTTKNQDKTVFTSVNSFKVKEEIKNILSVHKGEMLYSLLEDTIIKRGMSKTDFEYVMGVNSTEFSVREQYVNWTKFTLTPTENQKRLECLMTVLKEQLKQKKIPGQSFVMIPKPELWKLCGLELFPTVAELNATLRKAMKSGNIEWRCYNFADSSGKAEGGGQFIYYHPYGKLQIFNIPHTAGISINDETMREQGKYDFAIKSKERNDKAVVLNNNSTTKPFPPVVKRQALIKQKEEKNLIAEMTEKIARYIAMEDYLRSISDCQCCVNSPDGINPCSHGGDCNTWEFNYERFKVKGETNNG